MDRIAIEEQAKRHGFHAIFRERKVLLTFRLLGGEYLRRFNYRPGDEAAADAKVVAWMRKIGPLLAGLKLRAARHREERDRRA